MIYDLEDLSELASFMVKRLASNPDTIDSVNRRVNWDILKAEVYLDYDDVFSEEMYHEAAKLVEEALAQMQAQSATIH